MARVLRVIGASTARSLISDTDIRRDLGGLSRMAMWRWDHDPRVAPRMAAMGWPPPELVNGRKYRDAERYEAFRGRAARQAISNRRSSVKTVIPQGEGTAA
jgi:hypothetical protein